MAECFVQVQSSGGAKVFSFDDCTTSTAEIIGFDYNTLVFPPGITWGDILRLCVFVKSNGTNSVFRKNNTTQELQLMQTSSWTSPVQPQSTDNYIGITIASTTLSDWDVTIIV